MLPTKRAVGGQAVTTSLHPRYKSSLGDSVVGVFVFDEFELDSERLTLTRAGAPVRVDTQTVRLLELFLGRSGELVTKEELTSLVWDGRAISESALTVAIARLRRVLDTAAGPDCLVTVHGRGYRFVRPVVVRKPSSSALPPAKRSTLSRPFVGREPLLSQLHSALRDAKSQQGQIIVLKGEAGIGKTRVTEMLVRDAAVEQMPVAIGQCREAGDTPPLWPIVQVVRELINRLAIDESVWSRIPTLATLVPELRLDRDGHTRQVEHSNRPSNKHVVFDSVARFLALASDLSPCLIVLDDIHRADDATLELVSYLSDEIGRRRIVLVATLRPYQAADHEQLTRILGHRNSSVVTLQRLSEAEVEQYVETVVGHPEPGWSRTIFAKSEGNPFFMTQLVWSMSQALPAEPETLAFPEVALDVVRRRMAQLSAPARETLAQAAAIGRFFGLSLLVQVSNRSIAELTADLDEALSSDLVAHRHDSLSEFVFSHELLREVAYDDMPRAKRRELHLVIARALEARVLAGESIPPSDLAHHFRSAVPLSDPRKAVEWCIKAGTASAEIFAYADGARFLGYAREMLELVESASPRLRINLALRQALFVRAYSTSRFVPLIQNVIQLARAQNMVDPVVRATMLLNPYPGFEPVSGSSDALQLALELLPPTATAFRAAVLARQAITAPAAFDVRASEQKLVAAAALVESSTDVADRYNVLLSQLYLAGGPAKNGSAQAAEAALTEMFCEHASLMTVPPILLEIQRAIRSLQAGDLPAMRLAIERGEARGRALDSELHWYLQRFHALARIDAGDHVGGEQCLTRLHALANDQAIAGASLFCSFDQLVVLARAPTISPTWTQALEIRPDDPPGIWSLKVRVLAAAGLFDRALSGLTRVRVEQLAELPHDRDYLGTLGTLARAALTLRSIEYCAALFDLLLPHRGSFAANLAFACEGSVSQLLGLLGRALGRCDARAHLERGLLECERSGLVRCATELRLLLERK